MLQSHPQDVAAYPDPARTRTGDHTGARAVITGDYSPHARDGFSGVTVTTRY
ncbi:hypothetical protein [Kitasatospora sp. NPDC057198]|uniref:hypothetical protein n=1 Tax=Kitasatospora sp. NPDC057198 TaxID=3346046 RepID=UPI00362766CB